MSREFGKRLQDFRTMRGLSAKAISDAIGTPRSTYQDWENGAGIRNTDFYPKLAKAFDISVSELFADQPETNVVIGSKQVDDLILSICRRMIHAVKQRRQI